MQKGEKMANENKTAKEYVQKGYLIAHLANCGIRTINYDEWERLCECIHEAKPANVVEVVKCKDCTRQMICFHSDNYFCADGERREDDKG